MTRKITWVLVLALIMMFANGSTWAGECLETIPGLISYWQLNEGSGDKVFDLINPIKGDLFGDPVWEMGQVGGALGFDGIDDNIDIPDSDLFTPSHEITISFWTYYEGQNTGVYKYASCPDNAGSPGNSRAYFLKVDDDTAKLRVFSAVKTYDDLISNNTLSIDAWHHIAATFSYGQACIYIDGQLDNSTAMSVSSIMNDDQVFSIGGFWKYCNGKELFSTTGVIDDVAIFDRALSDEEISQCYQDGLNGFGYAIYPLTIAVNKINHAKTIKNETLDSVEDALNCETAVLDALNELQECDNLGEKQRRDIQRAKQDIRQAMVRERICKRLLLRSTRDLERSLNLLTALEQPEDPEPQPGRRRRRR